MTDSFHSRRIRTTGFTLVELLTVMAIIVLVATLIVPAVGTMLRGTDLTRAGQYVSDTIGLARQTAVKKNRDVYIVFYKLADSGPSAWRGLQVVDLDRSGAAPVLTPIEAVVMLPASVEISQAMFTRGSATVPYSPLLVQASVSGTTRLNAYGNTQWQGFRIRADGSLDRAINPAEAYVTIVSSNDNGAAPKNYYTVQVNSVTGMVRPFRP